MEGGAKMPKIRLRNITLADQPLLMRWRMLPEVTKFMYTDPVITLPDQERWFAHLLTDKTKRAWIIEVDGVDIGFFNFYAIDAVNRSCGWGYYIEEDGYQGKGIGKAVECAAYDYAFGVLGMNKAWAEVFDWNWKVVEIHQRMGCKIEARYPQHIFKSGRFYDVTRVCMLKEWWVDKPEHIPVEFESEPDHGEMVANDVRE
jgi:UDP-4-amino-4,6-dideoxy-N-acetyl-beta-L-altrosamine N-acetyltransferase